MRDAIKGFGALALVTAMLYATVAAAATTHRLHGARLMGLSGDCATFTLPGGEWATMCGGR